MKTKFMKLPLLKIKSLLMAHRVYLDNEDTFNSLNVGQKRRREII